MRAAGAAFDERLAVSPASYSLPAGVAAAKELVARGVDFDGVFAVTDSLALGVLRGFHEAGVNVPGDVLVVGFDDVYEGQFSVPSLTTVDPDQEFVARKAVALLLKRMKAAQIPDTREFTHKPRLVIRESSTPASTGCPIQPPSSVQQRDRHV